MASFARLQRLSQLLAPIGARAPGAAVQCRVASTAAGMVVSLQGKV